MSIFDMFSLHHKVVVITGGAGLLGLKHAEAIAEAGGTPILVDVDEERLHNIKNSHGFHTEVCDITKKENLTRLFERILKNFPSVDVLINNAAINPKVEDNGMLQSSRLENYSMESYEKELAVGLTAALLCTQIFGAHMAKKGSGIIINIASDLGLIAPNQDLYKKEDLLDEMQPVKPVTYSLIKHGLIGLTRYTATYWADKGVRCNALAPGGVENGQDEVFLHRIKKLIPMGRMGHVDEYKAAIVFLSSVASSYMNGAVLSIDGGRTAW